jgi:hypothetical protein
LNKPPIADVLEHYGATFVPTRHGWAKMRCPFHQDRNASASVNTDEGLFRCFGGCDIDSPLDNGGSNASDGFDIIAWKEGLDDFPSAKQCAEDIFGERYGDVLQKSTGKPSRRVFGESGPKRGQRNAFSSRVRKRTFGGT